MKVLSSFSPKSVEVIREEKRNLIIALRKNIMEIPEVDFLTGKELIKFEYDEVKVNVKNRQNVVQSIESNFENWFSKGLKLEQLGKEIKQKQQEIKRLTDEFGQIEVNEELERELDTGMIGLYEIHQETARLHDEINKTMIALMEVHSLITE